jgi:hypothetical protein
LGILALAIVLFFLTRLYLLFFFEPLISDIPLYFQYAAETVDLHDKPYQKIQIEYPPAAWWTILAPRLLDESHITRPEDSMQVTPVFLNYRNAFRSLMFFYDLASFIVFLLLVRRRRPELTGWAALLYVVTTAVLGHLLYDRLDVGLLLLLVLAAYAWARSLEGSGRPLAWTAAAFALVGLSISYKLIPLLGVPFLLLAEFHAPNRGKRLAAALLALAGGCGLPFLIQYAVSGSGVFALFQYHAEREIQIESLYATLMLAAGIFGAPVSVSQSHGSYNLIGTWGPAMKTMSVVLLLGFLAGLGLWALRRGRQFRRQDAYRTACYAIAAAVILSNVLSPQYFLWAIPLLLLLAVEILPAGKALPWILAATLVAVAALSTWIFPYHYYCAPISRFGLPNSHALIPLDPKAPLAPSPAAYIVLGVRNFVYLGAILWMGVLLFKHEDPQRQGH